MLRKHLPALFLSLVLMTACATPPHSMELHRAGFAGMPSWKHDAFHEALDTFRRSCHGIGVLNRAIYKGDHAPDAASNEKLCAIAAKTPPQRARQFFETYFEPFRVSDNGDEAGLFTGYYVPVLKGSLTRTEKYCYPVYHLPPELKGEAWKIKPFFTRAEIDNGALKGRHLELLWLDDPVMLFFMHVQGSGFVELLNGTTVRLSFAGKNGQPYHAIGKTLVETGKLDKDHVSMQAIRDWLHAHPAEAPGVMQSNPSYVFFKMDKETGHVTGIKNIPLTAKRSLAVDLGFIPAGWPVYLETTLPGGEAFDRLMIAQDTGTAIKGPVRGDIFFGTGREAEALAGFMKSTGKLTLLIPKAKALHD